MTSIRRMKDLLKDILEVLEELEELEEGGQGDPPEANPTETAAPIVATVTETAAIEDKLAAEIYSPVDSIDSPQPTQSPAEQPVASPAL
jgi:hypothetical protein